MFDYRMWLAPYLAIVLLIFCCMGTICVAQMYSNKDSQKNGEIELNESEKKKIRKNKRNSSPYGATEIGDKSNKLSTNDTQPTEFNGNDNQVEEEKLSTLKLKEIKQPDTDNDKDIKESITLNSQNTDDDHECSTSNETVKGILDNEQIDEVIEIIDSENTGNIEDSTTGAVIENTAGEESIIKENNAVKQEI